MVPAGTSSAGEVTAGLSKNKRFEEPSPLAEGSTTEEEDAGSRVADSTSHESEAVEENMAEMEANAEAAQEALRQYCERFGLASDSKPSVHRPFSNRRAFTWRSRGEWDAIHATSRPREQVLAELDEDIAVRASTGITSLEAMKIEECSGSAAQNTELESSLELQPTFGYAGSLDVQPPFAKFDIRDHMCLKVGGLRHGQVVRVRSGAEMVVVGVKEEEGAPRLWFQPKNLGRPGAAAFSSTSMASLKLRVSPLDRDLEPLREMKPEEFYVGEDLDGEEMLLCRGCRLPVGTNSYLYGDKKAVPVHGECLEQILLQDCLDVEREQKVCDAAKKRKLREDYDIGWRAWEVPCNTVPAMKLGCEPVPRGMCCVVFDEKAHTVRVAPTLEPAASVNLEYLSLALQVRLREGREPMFSLDTVDPQSQYAVDTMQAKRYEPEWLAGTCVGDVLFQADYHLKELSMGEYEQPVVGMKNCVDLQEALETREEMKEWSAREWFFVRKAEVLMNEDNILIPRVNMGVEAREQVLVKDEVDEQLTLVDKPMTRPNHPMVKYAKEFTRQFDLIAERKSVIYNLRDLAKASVLAKMLIEAEVDLQESWFDLAGEANIVSALEVPQLWNDRLYTQIKASGDGMEVLSDKERSHGVYGGVNFGLDQTTISMPSQVTRGRLLGISTAARPAAVVSAMVSPAMSLAGSRASRAPALGLSAMAPAPSAAQIAVGMAQSLSPAAGGGLSAAQPILKLSSSEGALRRGDFAAPQMLAMQRAKQAVYRPPGLNPVQTRGGFVLPGVGVSTITSVGNMPQRDVTLPIIEAKTMITGMLRPSRPMIGLTALSSPDMFVPAGEPIDETRHLQEHLKGVDLNLDQFNLRQPTKLKGHCSGNVEEAVKCAPLGGAFWASIDGSCESATAAWHESDVELLQAIYNPNLSDRREEGEHFVPPDTTRDYVERLRSLVQEEEEVREKRKSHFFSRDFSMACPGHLFPKSWEPSIVIDSKSPVQTRQLIARPDYKAHSQKLQHALKRISPVFNKISEEGICYRIYRVGNLEVRSTQEPSAAEEIGAVYSRIPDDAVSPAARAGDTENVAKVLEYIERAHDHHRTYIVLETDQGNTIVTEKLADGQVLWDASPVDLEFRNSLAKLMRSDDCSAHNISVQHVKECCAREAGRSEHIAPPLQSKRYARHAYACAAGDSCDRSAFARRQHGLAWQLSEKKYGLYSSTEDDEKDTGSLDACSESKPPAVGDMVQVRGTSRIGKVILYDGSKTPYKVSFTDDLNPKSKWYKENDLMQPRESAHEGQ